jgi:adenylate cyclase
MADETDKLPRRLRAVLLADMKDYSAIMGEDEAHAIAGVDDVGAVFQRVVPRHGGTYEITSGDRFFAVFDSAVEAFDAALEIQRALVTGAGAARPVIRMGMHLGEVVDTAFGLMGDTINVAARLETLAEPGGIAVSEDVYRVVRNRFRGDVAFRDLGSRGLHNIREPVRVYAVSPASEAAVAERVEARGATERGARPGRRAVLTAAATAVAGAAAWFWLPGLKTRVLRAAGAPRSATPEHPFVLGVMAVRTRGAVPDWMSDLTRDGLNTVLSKQPALRVYSRQKIDFLREKLGLTEIEAAERLGIEKMISANLSGSDTRLALEVQIIDIASGLIEGSQDISGSERRLIEMQNHAALAVMRTLKIPLDPKIARLIASRTNAQLQDYKLLTESMGGGGESAPPPVEPQSRRPGGWRDALTPAEAYAAADESDILGLLEQYRLALEAESLPRVEVLHVALPGPMRDALQKYFQNARQLRIRFSDVDVLIAGDEALATFTRSDDFIDATTGDPVHLEVRVSSVVAREGGGWKLVGLKKPA